MRFAYLLMLICYQTFANDTDIRQPLENCPGLQRAISYLHNFGSPRIINKKIAGLSEEIWRTERSATGIDTGWGHSLDDIYPKEWLEDLSGKTVLDVGTGDGMFVNEMNSGSLGENISAWGLDLYLNPSQKANPKFIQGISSNIPIKTNSINVAFSTLGFFNYISKDTPEGLELMRRSFSELHRVLSKNGRLRIAPINTEGVSYIKDFVSNFSISSMVEIKNPMVPGTYAIELVPIDQIQVNKPGGNIPEPNSSPSTH